MDNPIRLLRKDYASLRVGHMHTYGVIMHISAPPANMKSRQLIVEVYIIPSTAVVQTTFCLILQTFIFNLLNIFEF